MKHKNIGVNFDDFLKDEGILEHTEDIAMERVTEFEYQEDKNKKNNSKSGEE